MRAADMPAPPAKRPRRDRICALTSTHAEHGVGIFVPGFLSVLYTWRLFSSSRRTPRGQQMAASRLVHALASHTRARASLCAPGGRCGHVLAPRLHIATATPLALLSRPSSDHRRRLCTPAAAASTRGGALPTAPVGAAPRAGTSVALGGAGTHAAGGARAGAASGTRAAATSAPALKPIGSPRKIIRCVT